MPWPRSDIPAEVLAIGDDPAESQTIISDYYTANPDTDIFLTLGPNGANPFYAFMEAAGLGAGDMTHGTFDISPEIAAKIKDGTTMFGIDQQPFLQGYGAVEMLTMVEPLWHSAGTAGDRPRVLASSTRATWTLRSIRTGRWTSSWCSTRCAPGMPSGAWCRRASRKRPRR